MLHVMILILKIIGIALLSILGILLLLLLTVLFVPVRYRIDAQMLTERTACAKVTWLWHFISVPIVYDKEGLHVCLKIFGITVKKIFGYSQEETVKKSKKKKKKKKSRKSKEHNKAQQAEKEGQVSDKEERENGSKDSSFEESSTMEESSMASREVQHTEDVSKEKKDAEITSKEEPAPSPEKKEKKKFILWRILSGILEKLKKLKYTIRIFCVKIKEGIGKIQDLKSLFLLDCTQNALRLGWGQLLYLLKKLGPRHIRGWIHFGMEDPALTGQILGGISVVYGFFPKKLELRPDFEQAVLEGELHIRGHFHLITMAGIAWKLWWDKDVKAVYQKIKAGI